MLVNKDKKEYVCPWCIGGGAKLWEWTANSQIGVLALLLRQSSEGGGGDWYGYHKGYDEAECIECKEADHTEVDKVVGSWAGDSVAMVGDYDSSNLYDTVKNDYTNISRDIAKAFNDFIEITDKQLEVNTCTSCQERG